MPSPDFDLTQLATIAGIRLALAELVLFSPEHRQEVVRAARIHGLLPKATPAGFMCELCDCCQAITCLVCDADACAKCYTCTRAGCGNAPAPAKDPVAAPSGAYGIPQDGWVRIGTTTDDLVVTLANGSPLHGIGGPATVYYRPSSGSDDG